MQQKIQSLSAVSDLLYFHIFATEELLLKLRRGIAYNHLHRRVHFLALGSKVLGTESKLKATGSRLEFSWAVSAQDLNTEVEISLGGVLCSMQQAIRSPQGLQKWHKAGIFVRENLSNTRQKQ